MVHEESNSDADGLLSDRFPASVESPIQSIQSVKHASTNQSVSMLKSWKGHGTVIMYSNINYCVPVKEKGQKLAKHILKNVSGIMKPGLNAILGPTGSGKTTLLDVLAGRKDCKFLTGDVLVNGERQPADFRLVSGYVMQDDVVMGTLTVRENLYFSAALRLGAEFQHRDRAARVDLIIQDLSLSACADSKVGTEEGRGVSGGERKRTSIGMELITSPDVLFLDEPTTGLDATTACSVIKLLTRQAQLGRTIIFSIHQPRYSIFKLFDKITLLSEGEIVYNGPADRSLEYFDALGYKCETYNNPADFYLDIISKRAESGNAGKSTSFQSKQFANLFCKHSFSQEIMKEIGPAVESLHRREEPGMIAPQFAIDYRSDFGTQLKYLCLRAGRNLLRDPRACATQFIVMIIYALLLGMVYFRLKRDSNGIQNRTGVIFFIAMHAVFSNLSAVDLFIKERPIFKHECANGYYRVSAYFLSKVICDLIPMRIFPLLTFSAIVYFIVGFVEDAEKFWIFFLALLLTSLAAASLAMFVSSCIDNLAVANLLISLPLVLMMILSGFLLNINSIPIWLRWFPYISIFKYCLATLEINELENLTFGSECGIYRNASCPTGNDYLRQQTFHADKMWSNLYPLPVISGVFLLLCYVQLRRMKKYK